MENHREDAQEISREPDICKAGPWEEMPLPTSWKSLELSPGA